MNIRRTISFIPVKANDNGESRIRMMTRYNGINLSISVGMLIDSTKWSAKTQRCVVGSTHGKHKLPASHINKHLHFMEQAMERAFRIFEERETMPSPSELKEEYNRQMGKSPKEKVSTFFDTYDLFMQSEGKDRQWTRATYQKFETLKRHLYRYNRNLKLSDFTMDGLQNILSYFRDTLEERNNTLIKRIGFIKWFLRWADAREYNVPPAYKGFSPRLKDAERTVVFLEWDELMTLYEFELPSYLSRVRDVFCFCCFTSLRYSDVSNLKRSHVSRSHIEIVTKKTNDRLRIELNDRARAILDRYKDEEFHDDLALPIISHQKTNVYLKTIGKLVGLDTPVTLTYFKANVRHDETYPKYELLSMHAGRRTFICNALMFGIPPEIVMKWTGHSDYKAMKPYIGIADKAKADAMRLFNR